MKKIILLISASISLYIKADDTPIYPSFDIPIEDNRPIYPQPKATIEDNRPIFPIFDVSIRDDEVPTNNVSTRNTVSSQQLTVVNIKPRKKINSSKETIKELAKIYNNLRNIELKLPKAKGKELKHLKSEKQKYKTMKSKYAKHLKKLQSQGK